MYGEVERPTPYLSKNQNDFALNLLRESSLKNEDNSLIMSPLSISLALNLAYVGSAGSTRKQFDDIFVKGHSNQALNEYFQKLLQDIKNPQGVQLHVANRLYVQKTLRILDSYKKIVTEKFDGEFEQVDFMNNPQKVINDINLFVEKKTNGKIRNAVSEESISSQTRMILINAIYFKGDWVLKFDKSLTIDKTFYVDENIEKTVQMMRMSKSVLYGENEEVQVLSLPYSDYSASFVVFLPKDKFGLKRFVDSLDGKKLEDLKNLTHLKLIDVELPRFKIESQFEMTDILSKLGLDQGFSGKNANFSGITRDERICIQKVIHKGFIEVNEVNTEAAAVTTFVLMNFGKRKFPETPLKFVADHPFLYAIYLQEHLMFLGQFNG